MISLSSLEEVVMKKLVLLVGIVLLLNVVGALAVAPAFA
jgi:hypothetical protein